MKHISLKVLHKLIFTTASAYCLLLPSYVAATEKIEGGFTIVEIPSVKIEAYSIDKIFTMHNKGIDKNTVDAISFVTPDQIFDSYKPSNSSQYYDSVDVDNLFHELSRGYGQSYTGTDSENLLSTIIDGLEKIDPQKIHTESVLKNIKKYEEQIFSIIKKEKQLNELLDYIARLKKVVNNKNPMAKPFKSKHCIEGELTDYSWPRVSCG